MRTLPAAPTLAVGLLFAAALSSLPAAAHTSTRRVPREEIDAIVTSRD
ncbi:hypothetical protein [Luteimonas kalidii]|uniref:Uncharacterized protein n=1 Tax=Luteimonas kalidii TaxID=3042025 RepID=A0ABT6JQC5_9GAMM|nr:hypothetical protein [Luteimonas kalidii]MDH5832817.1 hypothetical protein [Luteimonas kalidii]